MEAGQGTGPRLILSSGMLSAFWFHAAIGAALVLLYFGLGLAFYMPTEGMHLTACVFFLTQTITTGASL